MLQTAGWLMGRSGDGQSKLRMVLIKSGASVWGDLAAPDGGYYVGLQSPNVWIEREVVGLVAGARYTVAFDTASRPRYGAAKISLLADGQVILGPVAAPATFQTYSADFAASPSGSTVIRFTNDATESGDRTVFLDNVRITPLGKLKYCIHSLSVSLSVSLSLALPLALSH